MSIWLYCQSCKQWSKSDTSFSDDKSCPFCANLFISLKPVVDSNPYKIDADQIQEQPDQEQPTESDESRSAIDADEEMEDADPEVNSYEPSEEPDHGERSEEVEKTEIFDFVEILEGSQKPAKMDAAVPGENPNPAGVRGGAIPEAAEAGKEEAIEGPNITEEPEESNRSETHVIQVMGKPSDYQDGPEAAVNNAEVNEPADSSQKKRRIKLR